MAIQEANKVEGKLFDTGYKTLSKMEFYIDSADDIENLPDENECLAGSKAIDTATGDIYVMNTEGEWNKVFGGKGGSGEESNGLPAVTSEDNGDVLTVVEGAWAKAAPSGGSGGGIFLFTITESSGSYSSDKTYEEIKAAYLAGAYLIAVNSGIYYPLINIMGLDNPNFYFMLTRIFKGDPDEGNPDNITSTQFTVTINGITKIVMNYES